MNVPDRRYHIRFLSSPLNEPPQDLRRCWRTAAYCDTLHDAQKAAALKGVEVLDIVSGKVIQPLAVNKNAPVILNLLGARIG